MSQVLVSLHGSGPDRGVGLDKDGYLTSRKGVKFPNVYVGASGSETQADIEGITTVTSITTGSTVSARGTGISSSTGASAFTLAAPVAGVRKQIVLNTTSTSTLARDFTLVSGNFQSTASSTYTVLTLNAAAQFAELIGISTARYQVLGLSAAAVLS